MNNKIFFPQQPVQAINPTKTKKTEANKNQSNINFDQILQKKILGELKFSQHAKQRLESRNINLDGEMEKIENAVQKAREKGSKDSLILMKDLALLVSVKNNTVITALDGDSIKENVFTNIDSAVII